MLVCAVLGQTERKKSHQSTKDITELNTGNKEKMEEESPKGRGGVGETSPKSHAQIPIDVGYVCVGGGDFFLSFSAQ